MKYMLLIHHGALAWDGSTEDEQRKVAADYKAGHTPGVTPGSWMEEPEPPRPSAWTASGRLTTDGPFAAVKEALGGYLFYEADDLRRRDRARVAHSGGAAGGASSRPLKGS